MWRKVAKIAPIDIGGRNSATLESEKRHSDMGFEKAARQKKAGKAKNAVTLKTFSSFRLTAALFPLARLAEMNGTKFTERAFVNTDGRNKRGITIPDTTPRISVASFLEKPYITSIAGISTLDADPRKVSAVLDAVTGTAVFSKEGRVAFTERHGIFFVVIL